MNRIKFHVKKGDNVEVISGNFRGSIGQDSAGACRRSSACLIEGVRMIKKHLRKSQDNPQGKIAEREGPIHISNVRLLETGTNGEEKNRPEKRKRQRRAG